MGRIKSISVACGAVAGLLLLSAARSAPGGIALASPGLWEFTGLPPGASARQCLANTAALARLEHRGQNCSETVISQNATTTLIDYRCATGGYGQTKLTMLTPRSLRIETQGISANLPFNYKIQARRVGDCTAH